MSTNRKDICRYLDRAAARADEADAAPATGKQCWYLAGLIEQEDGTADDVECGPDFPRAVLTKSKASFWIESYLNDEREAA